MDLLRPGQQKWKHKDIFETYLLLGPGRSFTELAKLTGKTPTTLRKYSQSFNWPQLIEERDAKVLSTIEDGNDKIYLEKVKQRHQKAYMDVQDKAMKQISKKKVSFDNDKDAAIALDIGIKGERDVLGLRDNKFKMGVVKEGFAAFVEAVTGSEGNIAIPD